MIEEISNEIDENMNKRADEEDIKQADSMNLAGNSNQKNDLTTEDNEEDIDIFDGEYEEFIEKEYYANNNNNLNFNQTDSKFFSSKIHSKRNYLLKVIISQPKKFFESPIIFQDKEPGAEGTNLDIKPAKANEYPMTDKVFLEIGLQTPNESQEKSFKVTKVSKTNNFTQVEENNKDIKNSMKDKSNFYLTNPTKITEIENFLKKIRSRMEEALQSNETIDIFQNDFDLDKNQILAASNTMGNDTVEKKAGDKQEIRTFRDNLISGQKSKKEKSVNCIKFINSEEVYVIHSLIRNLSFEERMKTVGIPYQTQLLIWNFKDYEINSPIFYIDTPMEITCFEICPTNPNIIVAGMISGQLIIYEINDLLGILNKCVDNETIVHYKKNLMTYYITPVFESHRTHIAAMQWFPKGFGFNKYTLAQNNSSEVNILATLGDDGYIHIWDLKSMDRTVKNDTSNYIRPVLKVEANKMDSLSKISGTGLQLRINLHEPLIYAATDEGQVYAVDWTIKITQENLTANIRKIYNGQRNFRPVLSFQFSPFFSDIFITLHDFYFCLWFESRTKPIFISPNLKSTCYTCARFSSTRPSVIYLARNNGTIDIWDFLDESHKPSVKETFVKENIAYLEIFKYNPLIEDQYGNLTNKAYTEYLAVGDFSGQLTMFEIPKLFSLKVNDEEQLMYDILKNEKARQEYMDMRYRAIDDEQYKQSEDINDLLNNVKTERSEKDQVSELTEITYIEEAFEAEKESILALLSLNSTTISL